MGRDEVQDAYDQALKRVLDDIANTLDICPDIAVDFTDFAEPEMPYRFEQRHWTALPEIEDEESAAVELADRVQSDVLEELWGPAWPECPGHGHPAEPCLSQGVAVWSCPVNGRLVKRIGELTR